MPHSPSLKKGWLAHYGELLRTWAWRSDSAAPDVQDAVHDVIATMLENTASAIHNPRAYLHRSVHNQLADMHRHAQVRTAVPLHELHEDEHPLLADPDAQLRTAALVAALKEALAELPLKCRQVFIWHRLEGYTQQEIADKLEISVNMVEKYMIRAMRHLRDRLREHAPN